VGDVRPPHKPDLLEGWPVGGSVERVDGDLHVDDVLGSQTDDRRRADVLDIERRPAECSAEFRLHVCVLDVPFGPVWDDFDAVDHALSMAVTRSSVAVA
jgi:hypothetical protein